MYFSVGFFSILIYFWMQFQKSCGEKHEFSHGWQVQEVRRQCQNQKYSQGKILGRKLTEKQSVVRGKEYVRTRMEFQKPLKVEQKQVTGGVTGKYIEKCEKGLEQDIRIEKTANMFSSDDFLGTSIIVKAECCSQ